MVTRPASDRLTFSTWRADDAAAFHAICSDPAVMRFIGDGHPQSWSEIIRFIQGQGALQTKSGYCLWALRGRYAPALLGFCGLAPLDDIGEIEIGWRLAQANWGRGLASEAASAVLDWTWRNTGLNRIVAKLYDRNDRSRRVAEKLGMRLERVHDRRRGMQILLYAIDRPNVNER